MGRGRIAPTIKDGDWGSVRRAINRLSTVVLGSEATPTFTGLTLSSMTQGSVLFAGASGVISQDNSNLFWDDTNNRLGIGTASPDTKLHVKGVIHIADPSSSRYFIEVFNTGGVGYIDSYDSTGNDYQDLVVRADDFIFEGEGTERFRITDTGNVGIGTTTPLSKLSINGGLHVGGDSDAGDNNLLVDGTLGSGVHTITKDTANLLSLVNSTGAGTEGQVNVGPGGDVILKSIDGGIGLRPKVGDDIKLFFGSGTAGNVVTEADGKGNLGEPADKRLLNAYIKNDITAGNDITATSGQFFAPDGGSIVAPAFEAGGTGGMYADSSCLGLSYHSSNTPVIKFKISDTENIHYQTVKIRPTAAVPGTLYIRRGADANFHFIRGGVLTASNLEIGVVGSTAAIDFVLNGTRKVRIDKDGQLGIGTPTPDTRLQVVGTSGFGDDSGNETLISATGDLSFVGTATVFEDIVISLSAAKVPAANAPTWSGFISNLNAYTYGLNDFQEFSAEIKHSYLEGSDIEFHIHGATNGLEGVDKTIKFEIEYELVDNNTSGDFGDTYTGTTIIPGEIIILANTADKTSWVITVGVDASGNFLQGASVTGRVRRIASTGTEPASDPFVMQIGLHVEQDTVGSRTVLTK